MNFTEVICTLIGAMVSVIGMLIKAKYENRSVKAQKLSTHPYFSRMKYLKSNLFMSFHLPNKGKEEAGKELLKNLLDIFHKNRLTLAEYLDKSSVTEQELYALEMEFLRQSMNEFSNFYKSDKYTDDERKILTIMLEKFFVEFSARVNNAELFIDRTCNSSFYTDIISRAAAISDMLVGEFAGIILDIEKAFQSINGDMKGLMFKSNIV